MLSWRTSPASERPRSRSVRCAGGEVLWWSAVVGAGCRAAAQHQCVRVIEGVGGQTLPEFVFSIRTPSAGARPPRW
jgi:hypothetical protein